VTADVIVGFPGEHDDAFERTLRVVEQAGLTKVHVFPYSPRPGTVSAADDTVSPQVKKARSARLRELSDALCRRRWQGKLGTMDRVLVDRPGRGYGGDYSPWLVDAPVGELVDARAVAISEEGIVAVAA
jgi:threonylcarbamoyladenosine tRNA methylthiotransferase MtaB